MTVLLGLVCELAVSGFYATFSPHLAPVSPPTVPVAGVPIMPTTVSMPASPEPSISPAMNARSRDGRSSFATTTAAFARLACASASRSLCA
jgi:hypothetical protein